MILFKLDVYIVFVYLIKHQLALPPEAQQYLVITTFQRVIFPMLILVAPIN